MYHVWDCEALKAYDSVFMLDDKKNIMNIIGSLIFEEFEFESMSKYLVAKVETVHKCRHKLAKYFGVYWYQRMEDKEWNEKKKSICVLVENVHTDEELCEYMCKQNGIREVPDNVQYRFLLIPKFKDGKGVVMLKSHHCMSDGLGFSTLFLCLSGEFDPTALPGVKPLGFVKEFIITLMFPFLALRAGLEILTTFRAPNSINGDKAMTGIKRGAFT